MKQIKLDTFDVDTLWKLKLKLLVRILMSCSMFNLVLRWVRARSGWYLYSTKQMTSSNQIANISIIHLKVSAMAPAVAGTLGDN